MHLRRQYLMLLSTMLALLSSPPASAEGPKRVTLDLGPYRGYWQIRTNGGEIVHEGECFPSTRCRETRTLKEDEYQLLFSDQPQSQAVGIRVGDGEVTITSGHDLVEARGFTLKLSALKPVTLQLNGYRGQWSIDRWQRAQGQNYFPIDGAEFTFEVVPKTTYSLVLGSGVSERFQVDLDGRPLLIDERGAVRIAPEPASRLLLETIDVLIYPKPGSETAAWTLDGVSPMPGRQPFRGASVVRLAQGSAYRLREAGSEDDERAPVIETGKACNMAETTKPLAQNAYVVMPIRASCTP